MVNLSFFPSILTHRCFSSHSLVICYKAIKSWQRGNISRGVILLGVFLFWFSLLHEWSWNKITRGSNWQHKSHLVGFWFLSRSLRGNMRLKGSGLEGHCEHRLTSLFAHAGCFGKPRSTVSIKVNDCNSFLWSWNKRLTSRKKLDIDIFHFRFLISCQEPVWIYDVIGLQRFVHVNGR